MNPVTVRAAVAVWLLFSLLPGPTARAGDDPPKPLAITNARLIDGTGASPVVGAVILINGKIITAAGTAGSVDIPDDASILDAEGRTVIPGLIDAHLHMASFAPSRYDTTIRNESLDGFRAAFRLNQMLGIGVTTIRDPLSPDQVGIMARKAWGEGLIPGSRPIVCGQGITSTGGHGRDSAMIADGSDAWRQAVREQIRRGADFIKLLPPYSRSEITAAVEETHAHQKKVTLHSGVYQAQYDFIRWGVEAGVDCVEHAYALPDDVIRMMADKDILCVPTVSVLLLIAENARKADPARPPLKQHLEGPEIFLKLRKAGIRMAVGTDAVRDNTLHYPEFYFDELEFFSANGYSPLEAIVAATKTGAEACFAADKYGTIEKGKAADLLILDADPLKDIRTLRTSIRTVIQDGRIVKTRADN